MINSGETQPSARAENGLSQAAAVPTKTSSNRLLRFGNEEGRFVQLWRNELRENANERWSQLAARHYLEAGQEGKDRLAATEAARQAVLPGIRSSPPSALEDYARSLGKRANAPESWDNIDDWAQAIVEKMKGAVHARPTGTPDNPVAGPIHMDLLQSLAKGHTPSLKGSGSHRPRPASTERQGPRPGPGPSDLGPEVRQLRVQEGAGPDGQYHLP